MSTRQNKKNKQSGTVFWFLIIIVFFLNCERKEKMVVHKNELNRKNNEMIKYETLNECFVQIIPDVQKIFPKMDIVDYTVFENMVDSIVVTYEDEKYSELLNTPFFVDTLNSIIYDKWKIDFDTDKNNLLSLLPNTVVKTQKGSCLGVSLIFLLVAEKLGYPLYGVHLPIHFFVRYDDGNIYRNIEPNRHGIHHPLDYYKKSYNIEDKSWYTLRSLSYKEVAAVFFYNFANVLMQNKKYNYAQKYYRMSLYEMDDFAEALGNLAIIYMYEGNVDSTRMIFKRALSLRPDLENLSINMGAFELSQNNYKNALEAYKNGLYYYPKHQDILYGLAYSFYSIGMKDSAIWYIDRMELDSDIENRRFQLKELIEKRMGDIK